MSSIGDGRQDQSITQLCGCEKKPHSSPNWPNVLVTIHYNPQHVGCQTAGDNSNVVGGQSVHGNHNTVTSRDTTTGVATNQDPKHESWWTRLRKRGVLVAFFTVVGGIAGVVGAVAAMLTLLGWAPWS